jgi:ATP-dependent Clp protease ATP-binding subunit ClpA
MHQIMPSCEASSYKGLSEVMKPYLTVGDLHVIGATTLDEFRIYVAPDPAMDRRFQKVFLPIPDVPQTIDIMKNLKAGYEKHHRITVSDKSIEIIVNCTEQHMRKRNQPDKSIIMMDAAMAHPCQRTWNRRRTRPQFGLLYDLQRNRYSPRSLKKIAGSLFFDCFAV